MTESINSVPDLPQAACRNQNPEIFFPKFSSPDHPEVEAAKIICRSCVEKTACLEWTLKAPEDVSGIWGGLTENERRSLRKRGTRHAS